MTAHFDPHRLLERHFPPIHHKYEHKDAQLYALSLGLGFDPLDAGQLAYVYEGVTGDALRTIPTFANVLAYPGFWARDADTGIDWRQLVHAEQEIILHATLPARGHVIGQNKISALWDRSAEKGALMEQQREIRDAPTGQLLATVKQLTLLRGNGGFGACSAGAPQKSHTIPDRKPDTVCDLQSSPQTALLYRLCGDFNPLHANPAVAKQAGFPRPILHGMATMGIAAIAVIRTVLNWNADQMKAMRVRFTAPALPGDTLRTEMWIDNSVVTLRTTALERGVVVLNNARVDL